MKSVNTIFFLLLLLFLWGCGQAPPRKARRRKSTKPSTFQQEKRKKFDKAKNLLKTKEYLYKKHGFNPNNFEPKSPEEIAKIHQEKLRRVNKKVAKRFSVKKLQKIEKTAEKKYSTINPGEKISVPIRAGRKLITHTGEFKGIKGDKIMVGNRLILKKDIPNTMLARMSPAKVKTAKARYIERVYFHPKAKYQEEETEKIYTEIKEKYGYICQGGKWLNQKEVLDKMAEEMVEKATPAQGGKSKKWWIYGASIQELGGGKAYFIMVGIASKDQGLISRLNENSWETRNGDSCSNTSIMMLSWEKDAMPVPSTKIKLMTICNSRKIQDVLSCAFRLKNENDWVTLSDYILYDQNSKNCFLTRCLRCTALIPGVEKQCVNCQACFK